MVVLNLIELCSPMASRSDQQKWQSVRKATLKAAQSASVGQTASDGLENPIGESDWKMEMICYVEIAFISNSFERKNESELV